MVHHLSLKGVQMTDREDEGKFERPSMEVEEHNVQMPLVGVENTVPLYEVVKREQIVLAQISRLHMCVPGRRFISREEMDFPVMLQPNCSARSHCISGWNCAEMRIH